MKRVTVIATRGGREKVVSEKLGAALVRTGQYKRRDMQAEQFRRTLVNPATISDLSLAQLKTMAARQGVEPIGDARQRASYIRALESTAPDDDAGET